MITEKIYDEVLGVLIKAYEDGTLLRTSPCGCEIGNLIAHYNGYKYDPIALKYDTMPAKWITKDGKDVYPTWIFKFVTVEVENPNNEEYIYKHRIIGSKCQILYPHNPEGYHQLRSIPLPLKILLDIEWAFETAPYGEDDDEGMFNGLMASIEILDKYFQASKEKSEQKKNRLKEVYNNKLSSRQLV